TARVSRFRIFNRTSVWPPRAVGLEISTSRQWYGAFSYSKNILRLISIASINPAIRRNPMRYCWLAQTRNQDVLGIKGERPMFTSNWTRTSVLTGVVIVGALTAWMAPASTNAQGAGVRHRMTKITETIYRADAPGTPGINSTSWVFINDADVLVTD